MRVFAALLLVGMLTPRAGFSQATNPSATRPKVKTEVGTMDGAAYRIDVPKDWNHRLVVYYHGYSQRPIAYKDGPPSKFDDIFLTHRYALIQSGYSVTGWALAKAYPETEALREYFISKYGMPSESFVTGESMGGTLTVMTIEKEPEYYNGALPLCGRLDPSNGARQHQFAMRAAFDYYFPRILPPLDPVPRNYRVTNALFTKVVQSLREDPKGAAAMRCLLRVHSDQDLAHKMLLVTYIVMDAQEKAGGNPFDNRNYIYVGTSNDRALNAGVKRYAADPAATQFLVQYYTPTGRLLRPMLALATTYDPVTNPSHIYSYELAVERQGRAQNFVQQYVNANGHCNFTPGEIWTAFNELVNWVNEGKHPVPGLLPEDPN